MKDTPSIDELLASIARLRDPECGCPWDLQQSFRTTLPYTLEEAYEVAEATEQDAMEDLCDELGDLLLQVVFHAQMASEQGSFTFADVVRGICDKLRRRHPHVFTCSPPGRRRRAGAKDRQSPLRDALRTGGGLWEVAKAREKN